MKSTSVRIADAPPGYLEVHGPCDIARHCELLSSVPAPGEVRAVVTPGQAAGRWHLDVAALDRPGLLAAFTGVLTIWGVDTAQAVLATWDDGAALEAFVVRSAVPPDSAALQAAFAAALDRPLWSPPIPDASITFDNEASPLYTACEVRAVDRPGLLHAVAVAIATAGADVHAAGITTIDGVACDRFDLSDGHGGKLDAALEAVIRSLIASGVTPGTTRHRPRFWKRNRA